MRNERRVTSRGDVRGPAPQFRFGMTVAGPDEWFLVKGEINTDIHYHTLTSDGLM